MSKKAASKTGPAEFLNAKSRGKFVLFGITDEDRKENGPIMGGSVEVEGYETGDKKPLVSGFEKFAKTEGNRRYLGLSLTAPLAEGAPEDAPRVHYYGKMFRNEARRNLNSPEYSGFITVLPCQAEGQYTNEEWDDAPVLQFVGWKRRNASDGKARIECNFHPSIVGDDEVPF